MTTKLVITEERYTYSIQWEEDGDPGGYLCQETKDGTGPEPRDRDSWEHWAASRAVRAAPGFQMGPRGAFWESQKEARLALRMAKEALKQERALPDWAEKALAEGWTPPKGWKA